MYGKIEVKSLLEWKIQFPILNKLTIKSIRIWNTFKKWLKNKEITTIWDFKKIAKSRLKISIYEKYFRYKNEKGEICIFKVIQEAKPFRIKQKEEILVDWIDIIGRVFKRSG